MTFTLTNALDFVVDDKPRKVVAANPKRSVLNISAGSEDLWFGGNENVRAGTIESRIRANERAVLNLRGEIWVIRAEGKSAKASFSQEFEG